MQYKIPIGVEFYKLMIDNGYYYVDKTLLIKDILEQGSIVTLFTRPRRFGKTLTQSMLKTFFEKEILPDGKAADNSIYFKGKKIMETGEEYTKHMGQYPVIFLSLKSAKQPTYEMALEKLQKELVKEYRRHNYILEGDLLLPSEKKEFLSLMEGMASISEYFTSLQFLSECLEKYHNQKVIILLDEYDVPLENAYFNDFYDKMVVFIRSLFESALKTNESLKLAVVTGCLRISKESIFTGLNNLDVVSVLSEDYAEYFGFTQNEVDSLLKAYGITDKRDEIKAWYDGYLFGKTEVYNPWSIINYVKDITHKNTEFPKPYWSNTSSNSIIRELIDTADNITKQELENLIAGGTIEKPVHEDITYEDIYKSQDNLWNFLFFTGYLRAVDKSFMEQQIYLSMTIPNEEILYIYKNNIRDWMHQRIKAVDFSELYSAILDGNTEVFENILKKYLRESISFIDSAENFYHGFLLGLLGGMPDYNKFSNRESGEGRYDIVLKPDDEKQPAIILELKRVLKFTEMENMCYRALQQIEDKHYDESLLNEGYTFIKKYGVCFCRKSCMVKIQE